MTYDPAWPERVPVASMLHGTILAFPVACFCLTVATDAAYWQTLNLLWLHFSEWLLLAGLVFGVLALIARIADRAIRGVRPPWPAVVAGTVAMLLAMLNSLVHTADGWTAVVPRGLALSVATVAAMAVAGWFGRWGVRHA